MRSRGFASVVLLAFCGACARGHSQPAEPITLPGKLLDWVAADLNGDGRTDLCVMCDVPNGKQVQVVALLNEGGALGQVGGAVFFDARPRHLVAVDLDGDGDEDIAHEGRAADRVGLLRASGDARAPLVSEDFTSLGGGRPLAALSCQRGQRLIIATGGGDRLTWLDLPVLDEPFRQRSIRSEFLSSPRTLLGRWLHEDSVSLAEFDEGMRVVDLDTGAIRDVEGPPWPWLLDRTRLLAGDLDGDGLDDLLAIRGPALISATKLLGGSPWVTVSEPDRGVPFVDAVFAEMDDLVGADLVTLVGRADDWRVVLVRGDGAGGFPETEELARGDAGTPRRLLAVDLDGERPPEVVVVVGPADEAKDEVVVLCVAGSG